MASTTAAIPRTGLLLTGGGARAAYQVGVLEALAEIRRQCGAQDGPTRSPSSPAPRPVPSTPPRWPAVPMISTMRCGASPTSGTTSMPTGLPGRLAGDRAHRCQLAHAAVGGLAAGALAPLRPRSLLDNTPIAGTAARDGAAGARARSWWPQGHLHALAVTASSYSSGEHVTFFEGAPSLSPGCARSGMRCATGITHQHLLASSAIPFVFPAKPRVPVNGRTEYFGDGSMRQSAPVAPAIHLGADRILVVGAGRMTEPPADHRNAPPNSYPTLAQIAGTRCPTSSWMRWPWMWSACGASTTRSAWCRSRPARAAACGRWNWWSSRRRSAST
jgi:NTE family protein